MIYIYVYIYIICIYIYVYTCLINIYTYYICMYVSVYDMYIIYVINRERETERERADTGLAKYYDMHMFPPYPNFIHFEKHLLHNRLKEYAFSPTFKCIHQLCLLSGRKGK